MTVDIRIAASVETVARWQLAADRARFPLHEWIVEYLNVASDPDAGQVVDVSARLRTVEAERNRGICSNCGEDFDGDPGTSSDCCACDVMPATALPGLLKGTRREADENEALALAAEARVEAARLALETLLDWAERYRGLDKELDSEEWYIARDAARAALAVSGNQPQ